MEKYPCAWRNDCRALTALRVLASVEPRTRFALIATHDGPVTRATTWLDERVSAFTGSTVVIENNTVRTLIIKRRELFFTEIHG
jgi:hypothetical protein